MADFIGDKTPFGKKIGQLVTRKHARVKHDGVKQMTRVPEFCCGPHQCKQIIQAGNPAGWLAQPVPNDRETRRHYHDT